MNCAEIKLFYNKLHGSKTYYVTQKVKIIIKTIFLIYMYVNTFYNK